jgi:hypothetical protein
MARSASAVISIADTNNNAYVLETSGSGTVATSSVVYSVYSVRGCAGGSNTITMTSTVSAFLFLVVHEYSGNVSPNVWTLDGLSVAAGSGTSISSGNFSTAIANDALTGMVLSGATPSAGSGFTGVGKSSTIGTELLGEYQIVTSTGTYAATFSSSPGDVWICAGLAYGSAPAPASNPIAIDDSYVLFGAVSSGGLTTTKF